MRPDTIKSAHSKFGMPVSPVKLFGRDSRPKRIAEQDGALSKTADEIQTFFERSTATAWFERHSSSTAAEHHRSQREAPFSPSPCQWSNTLKSTALQLKGYPCAGELMRSGTVKDDLAIATD